MHVEFLALRTRINRVPPVPFPWMNYIWEVAFTEVEAAQHEICLRIREECDMV